MLLELQVYFFPDNYDPEEDTLIRKSKIEEKIVIINTDHIVSFYKHDSGDTVLRLTNGDSFQTTMKFDSFREIMEGMECSKDMFVSGEN
jgi:hypothetical protein